MSVIIKGFEIPKHCIDCPCMVEREDSDDCVLQSNEQNEKASNWEELKANCPLAEIHENSFTVIINEALGFIADINPEEIASHIAANNLNVKQDLQKLTILVIVNFN